MNKIKVFLYPIILLLISANMFAFDINVEGTYKTSRGGGNDRPCVIAGGVDKKGPDLYEGELTTNWHGSIYKYKGTITGNLKSGEVKIDFIMTGGRRFAFPLTANNNVLTGTTYEIEKSGNKANCGTMEMRVLGGGGGKNDYSDVISDVLSRNTGVSKEKILEYFQNKMTADEVNTCCVISKVTKKDIDELIKERKKVSTNYEFINKKLMLDDRTIEIVNEEIKKNKEDIDYKKKKAAAK